MKRQVITMQKSTNLSIDEAFSNFIKKSKIRNLSDKTLNTYHNHYKVFSELIDNTTPIADVTSDTLDDFIVYLREQRKVNDVTVNTYLRTLRAFLYYCMDCGYLKAFKIKMPKVEKKIKETYTNDELERLLEKPDVDSCGFAEFKINMVFAGSGIFIGIVNEECIRTSSDKGQIMNFKHGRVFAGFSCKVVSSKGYWIITGIIEF